MDEQQTNCGRCGSPFFYRVDYDAVNEAEHNHGYIYVKCPSCGYRNPEIVDSKLASTANPGGIGNKVAEGATEAMTAFGGVVYYVVLVTTSIVYTPILLLALGMFVLGRYENPVFYAPAVLAVVFLVWLLRRLEGDKKPL